MFQTTRRALLFAAALAVPAMTLAAQPAAAETVLRVIPHADLKNIDPIWTTAYITRNHGYMVYDTLFAMDKDLNPQPQMVDTWTVSDDQLTWTFKLRDGLKWHDGAAVTAEDCVASIQRWGKRDGMGQALMTVVESLGASDDKTIVMKLSQPYGLVLESLGKISSNVPFMMPKRFAETDAFTQVTDMIGSGPFKFSKDEWVPGSKVVYLKNEDYVPRSEPPSYAAGGKVVKVDKVEWTYFPDSATAMNALIAGEVDYFEQPPNDLSAILKTTPGIVVEINDPLGNMGFARFNHLLPPFDNAKVRRAAMHAMKQEDYLLAAVGVPDNFSTCYSVFPCGSPLSNDAGSDIVANASIEEAKKMLADSGYDGTPVVIMQPTDIAVLSAFSLVTAEKLRQIGMTVDMQAMDWSTLTSRRAKRDPVSEGGWNIFHTWWIGADVLNPMAIAYSGDPEKGWFGWAADAELEKLRAEFAFAKSVDEQKAIATKVQDRLYAIGSHGNLGAFFVPVAYRDNVKGLIKSPVQFFWNIEVER